MTEAASPSLADLAANFAADMTTTIRAVVGPLCPAFVASARTGGRGSAVIVRQEPSTGIPLMRNGEPLLTITVDYRCTWDGASAFLAIAKSSVKVYPRDDLGGEPLMRYEYVRDQAPHLPAAHLHVHGDHFRLSEALADGGEATKRGRANLQRAKAGDLPDLRYIHFPVGGHRFRPCLEDIVAVCLEEFGVAPGTSKAAAQDALAEGRARWRRAQVAAATRDCPEEAVRVLRMLGYAVTPPSKGEHAGQPGRMRDL